MGHGPLKGFGDGIGSPPLHGAPGAGAGPTSQAQAVGMQNLRHETLGGGQPHPQTLFCMELDTMWALHWVPSDLGSSQPGGPSTKMGHSNLRAGGAARSHWWGWDTPFGRCKEVGAGGGGPSMLQGPLKGPPVLNGPTPLAPPLHLPSPAF